MRDSGVKLFTTGRLQRLLIFIYDQLCIKIHISFYI